MKHKIQDQIGTILLVDDEISNIELLQKILEQSKHNVSTALNASKALNILSDKSKSIDRILLDLIMPGMNGIELLQKLKKDEKKNEVVIDPVVLSVGDGETTTTEGDYGMVDVSMDNMSPVGGFQFQLHGKISNPVLR